MLNTTWHIQDNLWYKLRTKGSCSKQFCCLHALTDNQQGIYIRQKTLYFSTIVTCTVSVPLNHKNKL